MSEKDVDIVRRVYAASARRDSRMVLSLYDPDVEWDMSAHPMSQMLQRQTLSRGHDQLRSWFHEWYEMFEDFEHTCEELIDAGGHTVVSVGTDRGRGRGSGVEVARLIAGVWTIRDGRIARVVWYPTREQALEAAALSA